MTEADVIAEVKHDLAAYKAPKKVVFVGHHAARSQRQGRLQDHQSSWPTTPSAWAEPCGWPRSCTTVGSRSARSWATCLHDVSGAFTDLAEAISLDHEARLHTAMTPPAPAVSLDECTFLPPIPPSERILCIGVNYADHRAESQTKSDTPYPTVFSRFPSSVVGHQVPIVRPRVSDRFDWEGELAVVIGRAGRYISADDARSYIAGYTCFMDGSIRDYQRHASQFLPGKTFDASGSCGPFVVTIDEVGSDDDLTLTTLVNGVQMQRTTRPT